MEAVPNLIDILKAYGMELPVMIACLAGFSLVLVRKECLGEAALPAAIGFGLASLLSLFAPILWTVVIPPLFENDPESAASIHMAISMLHSMLWAVVMLMLILGVIKGRRDDSRGDTR